VLCELLYKWFTPISGTILDPFAGGSVRGIVANYLGYHYTGIDLRPEQIAANKIQADNILKDQEKPTWIIGDSKNIDNLIPETTFEGFLTCPPYFNLELYSDDENDISNCDTYDSFIDNYNEIIQKSVAKLNNNRFACIVVGDIRDKAGFYHGFVCDTIDAFENAGMKLYNDAILVPAVGSLPSRVGRQFGSYRKLGKTHQNVLIFFKGNPKQIPIDFAMPESVTNEEQDLFSFT
ncbi:MAG: chromosome partitioning protein ParB, partial [Minisyncoccales bacterium]